MRLESILEKINSFRLLQHLNPLIAAIGLLLSTYGVVLGLRVFVEKMFYFGPFISFSFGDLLIAFYIYFMTYIIQAIQCSNRWYKSMLWQLSILLGMSVSSVLQEWLASQQGEKAAAWAARPSNHAHAIVFALVGWVAVSLFPAIFDQSSPRWARIGALLTSIGYIITLLYDLFIGARFWQGFS